ncbi:MAG: nuclear transport factor 2 family protein [Planctomycetota bacterium]|nr:MAG: nuclear transport factor 2 family protein [Planctomycetota bacterium]
MRSFAAVALLLPAACAAAPQPADILAAQVEAWNAGDLEAFAAGGYWQSPELTIYSGGEVQRGFDAMLERYRATYGADPAGMGRLEFRDTEVLMLDPANALVRGRWRLEWPDGTTRGGLFTLLFHRFPEGWRIVHDHTSSAMAPSGTGG